MFARQAHTHTTHDVHSCDHVYVRTCAHVCALAHSLLEACVCPVVACVRVHGWLMIWRWQVLLQYQVLNLDSYDEASNNLQGAKKKFADAVPRPTPL